MKRLHSLILLPLCALLLAGCGAPARQLIQRPVAGKLRLDGVTVVDTHDGKLAPGMSLLMDQGRIVRIAPTPSMPDDPSIQSIDASGKFVVPGYNDMHAHPLGPDDPSGSLALMLANGVTGFRQMQGSPELLKERREGTLPMGKDAPALLVMPGSVLTPLNAGSVADAVEEIQQQKKDGADFIKVVLVSPEVFFAAIAEAKRVGLPIAGHLAEGAGAAEASRAGFDAVEHLGPGDMVWVGCSRDESALRAELAQRPALKGPPIKLPFLAKFLLSPKRLINPVVSADAADLARTQRAMATYDEEKCRALAATLAADGHWQVPTLMRLRTMELADLPEFGADPNLRYLPPETVQSWREVADDYGKLPPDRRAGLHASYPRQLALTRLFADAGVRMMAGTDMGGGWEIPGFSLHQEFDELAKAGLSPLKILQMTTLHGAEFLGRTETMGSVAEGKNADLVLLDANPIESVGNLHRIDGVVRAGFYYSREDLEHLKARVEAGHGYLR